MCMYNFRAYGNYSPSWHLYSKVENNSFKRERCIFVLLASLIENNYINVFLSFRNSYRILAEWITSKRTSFYWHIYFDLLTEKDLTLYIIIIIINGWV